MAELKNNHEAPPGGWRYVQFETKIELTGEFERELVNKVIAHRAYKNLTPLDYETVRREVNDQICLGVGRDYCNARPGEDYRPVSDQSHTITLAKIMSFSASVFEWLLISGGSHLPDVEESQRRAEICRGCAFNRVAGSCSCSPLYKLIDSLVPKNRRMGGLHICGACGCTLMAKVVAPMEVVLKSNEGRNLTFPSYCWQNPPSPTPSP